MVLGGCIGTEAAPLVHIPSGILGLDHPRFYELTHREDVGFVLICHMLLPLHTLWSEENGAIVHPGGRGVKAVCRDSVVSSQYSGGGPAPGRWLEQIPRFIEKIHSVMVLSVSYQGYKMGTESCNVGWVSMSTA